MLHPLSGVPDDGWAEDSSLLFPKNGVGASCTRVTPATVSALPPRQPVPWPHQQHIATRRRKISPSRLVISPPQVFLPNEALPGSQKSNLKLCNGREDAGQVGMVDGTVVDAGCEGSWQIHSARRIYTCRIRK
jgi:hypothetical protein